MRHLIFVLVSVLLVGPMVGAFSPPRVTLKMTNEWPVWESREITRLAMSFRSEALETWRIREMIKMKSGVKLLGLKSEILAGMVIVSSIYDQYDYDTTITSGVEGSHSRGSKHYAGLAMDFRTRHITGWKEKVKLRDAIAEALGSDFDVLLESTHIHVEYDPKTGVNS